MTVEGDLRLAQTPVAKAEMLIRRPIAEVFEAFIDPTITSKFWFTNGSGRLEPGAKIRWEWEMYGASAEVEVKTIEQNERILVDWGDSDSSTTVEWRFTHLGVDSTFVSITNSGLHGTGDEIVQQVVDSTEGFALVLANLKALLEHNITLNLVLDRFPKGIEDHCLKEEVE